MYISTMKKYNSLSEWRNHNPKEYSSAHHQGWLDDICELMGWDKPNRVIPKDYWTKEKCIEHAKKYETKTEWGVNSNRSFKAAKNNGWYEECTKHMKVFFISVDSWTNESCLSEAKKYNNKTQWVKGSHSSFKSAKKNGWIDECTKHMEGVSPKDYWTKERCREYAIQYNMKERWKKGHNISYSHARRYGWVKELCVHMVEGCKKPNYWTKERCHIEALKFKVKEAWKKGQQGSYQAARRNGWVDDLCTHMEQPQKPNGYWTKERCLEHAKQFKTINEWTNANSSPAINARRYGWIDECTKHMIRTIKPGGYWKVKENVVNSAKEYDTITKWARNNSSSYKSARINGWFEEVTRHMEKKRYPPGYWTKEKCVESANKCKSPTQWLRKYGGAHSAARNNGWYEECTKHMK